MQRKINFQNSDISFYSFGNGSRLAVALHGYGEGGSSYASLSGYLGVDYTLICPDIPFHGETKWNKEDFRIEDLYEILNTIIPLSLRKITLIGFSMGGRMALALAEKHPEIIERLILIAPDGLHKNFWYRFSTQTAYGNKLFKYTMKKPHWLFNMMKVVQASGLMNKSVFKFAHHYLDDGQARTDLYERWTAFRFIKPSVQSLKKENRFKTLMVFGKYDRIILPVIAQKLAQQNECIQVKIIHAGHQLLSEKHTKRIAELILKET
jgi:pimeloyl-ACP methyl ester carboxylesterase